MVAKDKRKTVYICSNCGEITPRWLGKCPSCGEWNTLAEDIVVESAAGGHRQKSALGASSAEAKLLQNISNADESVRIMSGIGELDRVLGGGIVKGSVVLLGGEPGAGKSTLLLQLCGALAQQVETLYVTGEESERQIKLRADRLALNQENVFVAAENDIDVIENLIIRSKPDVVVIDSIQTMLSPSLASSPGSVSQVKECASRLMRVAKEYEIPVFIVGHVNKDGAIAGPKVMEHIVDTVLYFEGDRTLPYRILRAVKNRYGSTNEIGMFDMGQKGLIEISNPSEMMLEGRPTEVSGNCVSCIMEGTRPLMAEVQALATKSGFGTPRRAMTGVDTGRSNLLLAIIEKRAGFNLGNLDVYINVVGGIQLNETSCDLPVCLAVISSILDQALPEELIALGEIGLGGEIRSVTNIESRLKEAQRIGFRSAIIPYANARNLQKEEYGSLRIRGIKRLDEALQVFKFGEE